MEDKIKKLIAALPDEALDELNGMLDGDFNEGQIQKLFEKYNIDIVKVFTNEEVR